MALDPAQVTDVLRTVNDPELHRDLVTLGMVKQVNVCDGVVRVGIELTTPACPLKDRIRGDIEAALHQALGDQIKQVAVEFSAAVKGKAVHASAGASGQGQEQASPQEAARANNPLPGVKHIIAVGAGKGGVGKSTVAVNLAVGLARDGAAVGLLDGDIYGPSLPTMLGVTDQVPRANGNTIIPFDVHGLKAMTIGVLVEDEKPLIWRGPMAHGAFRQLATQTAWGELDYLIIDLPPGTGDVPLTMAQLLPLTGAVVVCTPQKVAQDDARRALRMFQQLGIEILGVVENMSYFIGDDGKEYDIFGRGGAEMMAHQMAAPFLGAVPINMALRRNCDAGDPTANFGESAGKLAAELTTVVRNLAGQVSVAAMSGALNPPTLSVR
jgi:ATP-binding protein involved in chromosome partitioning